VGLKVKEGSKLGRLVSFRLNEADYAVFKQKVDTSGIPMADFCRKSISQDKVVIIGHPASPKDYSYALYILNRVDKSIGMIAREIDRAFASGTVREVLLDRCLEELVRLNSTLECKVLDAH
jgi:hypothetical protein